jgi:hypothetical protein
MRSGRLLTQRRRAWGLLGFAVCVATALGLETHNWNDLPESLKYGLLVVGLAGLLALLFTRPDE